MYRFSSLLKTTIIAVSFLLAFNVFGQIQIQDELFQTKRDKTFYEIQREFYNYWSPYNVDKDGYYYQNGKKQKAPYWKQFKRWEYYWENRVDPVTGSFPTIRPSDVYEIEGGGNRSGDGNWVSLGPSSTSGGYAGLGRLNCLYENGSTLYAGAASGGLWKSTNNGVTWAPLTDNNPTLGVSAIAVIPTAGDDIVYIGTGDRDGGSMWSLGGGQNNDNNSVGVLKSADGGVTWSTTGLSFSTSDQQTVNRLLIDPGDNSIIYAATSDGIYKTTDGGATWPRIITGGFVDLEFKPGNSQTIYGSRIYGQIYITTDGWNTFTNVLDDYANGGRRVELAVTQANSNYVYAIMAYSDGGLEGIYRSTDSGNSFTKRFDGQAAGNNLMGWYCDGSDSGGQGSYDLAITADPTNANRLIMGGVNSWRSTDGGASWSNINMWTTNGTYNPCGSPAVHADKHELVYFGSNLYECNDGGLYRSTNNGTSWTHLSNGMEISQIYRIGVGQASSTEVMAGLQDNGSKNYSGGSWTDVLGGDGFECAINPANNDIQYGSLYYGDLKRTANHWGNSTTITPPLAVDGHWVTPFVIDPNSSTTLYAGFVDVWKSTNSGTSWSRIYNRVSGTLRSLAVAPSNSSYIYTATQTSIFKTTNGGTSWTDITGTLPVGSSYITYISVKNNDPNTVWVSMGAYNSYGVYQTTNGGTTWTNISAGLPSIPVMCVIQNKLNTTETELYAATDVGVYAKVGSGNWFSFNNGLPNVVVTELEIYYDNTTPINSRLRAASYGRGLWESDLYSVATAPPVAEFSADNLNPQTGQTVTFTDLSTNTPSSWSWSFSPTTITYVNSTSSMSQNPQVQFNAAGLYTVTLQATNGFGNDTEVKTNYIDVFDCSAITSYPYIQTFDSWSTSTPSTSCTPDGSILLEDCWTNVTGDNIDWEIYTGATGSTDTGPTSDHTGSGNYLYTETSGPCVTQTGYITSPTFDLTSLSNPELKFWYHMYGATMGTLSVQISVNGGSTWSGNIWSQSGNQGNTWIEQTISLSAYTAENDLVIRFTGLTGSDWQSDMAIDDFSINGSSSAVVDAGSNATICEGNTHSLADASASNYTSLSWSSSGDGSFNNSTIQNPIYTPGSTDISSGTVTLTLTGQPGNVSDDMTLMVSPLSTADAGSATATVCYNASYTANATATNASSILWTSSGDGSFTSATVEDAEYTPGTNDIANGTVTLTMTVTGSCNTPSDNIVLTITPESTADAGDATATVCYNASYTANATATNASSILWTSSGDGSFTSATEEDAEYTPGTNDIANGTVTLTMTVTGACNTPSDNIVLTITPESTADAGDATATVCYNASYTASATATNASSILWTSSGDGSFTSATVEDAEYTPGTNDIANGTVTLTMTVTGACNTPSDNIVLTITPESTADAGSDGSVCYNGTYTLDGTATNGTILWTSPGGGSFDDATQADAVYTPSATDISNGSVTLTMTVTGACNSPSDDMILTITPESTADAGTATATICYDQTYTASATATNASSILWTSSGDGGFTSATVEDAVYTPGTNDIANGTVTLTMTVTGACNSPSDDMILTITPESTADAGSDGSVCYNGTYTLDGTATNGTILWTSPGGGSFDDATSLSATYTPSAADETAGTVTLTLTAYAVAPCTTDGTDDMILTITPESTADAGDATATVCYNASYTASATASNGTILWTSSGDGSFTSATVEDAEYTPGTNDIANGTVTLTMTVTGACNTPSDNIVLTITPESTADAGSDGSVCYNGTYQLDGTATNGTILWTSPGGGSFDDATQADAVYTPSATDISNGSVTLTMTVTGACNSPSDDMILTITPESTADAGTATATICYDQTYTASATATNASSILWTSSGDGGFTSATVEDAVYTPGTNDIANGTVTLTMTVTGACNSPSDDMILTITPESTADAGSDGSVCYNGTYTLDGTATNGTILWTSPGGGSFDDATQADAVYTPSATDISNGSVTLTMTVTGACNSPSDDMILTITPESTADAGTATATICYDQTYTASATATNASSILWTSSGDGGFTSATVEDAVYTPGTNDIANGTVTLTMTVTGACNTPSDNIVLTITPESTADAGSDGSVCYNGTYQLDGTATNGTILWTSPGGGSFDDATQADAVYTLSATDISNGSVTLTMTVTGACNSPSDDMILTITPESTADAGTATATICYDQTYTASATATNASSILWTSSGDGGFTSATVEDAVYTPGTNDIAAGTVTLTMTVTGACNTPSDNIVLTITPESTADAGDATATVCYNASYTASATATNASSILWTSSGDGSFTSATVEDAEYTPGTNDIANGTVTLTMTVTGACNTPSDNIVLTITPESTADAGSDGSVCYNGTYTLDGTATNGTILWTSPGGGSFDDATQADAVYTPSATDISNGSVTLTMTVTGACNSPSDDMILTITPESTADAGTATATICYDQTYTASATATNASSILWTSSGDGGFTSATVEDAVYTPGTNDIANGTVTLTMTVTGACNSPSDDMILTITPESTADAGSDGSVCYNGTYTLDGTATNGTILWTSPGGGSFDDATQADAVYTPSATDISNGSVTLTMTVTGACNSPSDDMILTITPESTADAGTATATICYDQTYTASATATNASSILWTSSGDGGFTSATVEDAVYTPGTNDIANGTVTLTMTVTGACNSPSDDMILTITPESTADAGSDGSVCYNGTYTLDGTATNGTILWTSPGGGSFDDATSLSATYTPSAADETAGTVTLTLTAYAVAPCTTDGTDDMILTITPESTADAGDATATVCYNASYTASATASNGTILWTSSGDGSFTSATVEDAEYTPGTNDIANGTVTLTMTVTGSCNNPSDNIVLTITPESTADAGDATATVCYNASYTANATATNASSILWTSSGDGSFTSATVEDAEYTPGTNDIANGTVTLTMTVTGTCNNPSDNIVLTITPESTADAGTDGSVCYNGTYQLDGTATHGTILWSSPGGGSFDDATQADAVYTPSATDISNGSVTLTMTVTGACNSPSDDMILTIDQAPTANAGTDGNLCNGASYTLDGTATNHIGVLWSGGDGTFNPSATVEDPVYSPGTNDIANGTVTLTFTASDGCGSTNDQITITINDEATAQAGSDASICEGQTYTLSGGANGHSSVLWSTSGTGSFDDATSLSATYTTSAADETAGTVTLTLTAYAVAPCTTDGTDDMVLTITPESTADAGDATATVCYNASYTASATATNASSILWTSSGDGSFTSATVEDAEYTPGTNDIANGTVTLTMTVTGACNNPSDNIVLTITPESTADAGAATATVCYNASYTASATATNASSILWTSSGDGSFTSATVEDAVYTPGTNDIAAGTVTLTMTVTGACNSPSDEMILTITPESTADAGAATATICYDETYTASATATNASSILWTSSGDGSFTSATVEDAEYTPGTNDIAAGTVTLTMTVTGTCNNPSDNIVLTITPESTADAGDATATVCYNASYTASATATNASSILWTSSGDGSFTSATVEDAEYTPGTNDIVNGTVTLTMTVTGACNNPSDDIVLTITPESTADAGDATATVCYNASYTASATASNGTILWTSSGDGSFTSATVEDAVYTPGTNDIAAGTVTLTMTVTGTCNNPSDNIVLTITPESTADAGDATATVCYNASYTASATASNGTILWTSSGDGSFTSATVEDAVYTPGTNDIAAGTVTLTMTVTGSCNTPSDNIVLTITPESTADAGDATATVCYNASYTASATASNGTILWTSSGDGSFTNATVEDAVYTPGTNDIAAGTVTLTMTVTGTCNNPSDNIVLTITPESTADAGDATATVCYNASYTASATATNASSILWTSSGDGSFTSATVEDAEYTPGTNDIVNGTVTLTMTVTGACNNPSDDIVLTITPESTADAGDATATVCYNASYTASATASNGTILWTSSGDGSFTSATVEDAVYTPGTNDIAAGTVTLTMTVTGTCNNPSDNIVLTITPESTADAGDATATVCYNASYTASATASNGTILWTSSGDGSFTNATVEDAVYTPGTNDIAAGTVTLTMTVTGSCNTPSDNIVLTITPESTADAGDATATVCYNASYTASATASNGTILWTSSGDGSFTNATVEDAVYTPGTNDIAAGTVTLTMTVTGTCNNPSDNIVLTITPESTADAGDATATVCYNASYTASSTASNGTILWTSSGDGSFTSATVEDAVYTPGTNDIAAGTVTLTMTVTGTCNSPSDNIVLTITPESTADAGTDGSVCYNGTYQLDGTATHGTILWSSPGGGSFDDATQADAVYTPSATDISNGSVTLTMTVTGACNSPSDDMILTIDQAPTANAGADGNLCNGASYTLDGTATNHTGVLWSGGDGTFNPSATVEDPVYSPGTNDIANGTVTLTFTASDGCGSTNDQITITINDEATAQAGSDASICEGQTYTLSGGANGHSSVLWSTSGTGSFDDATSLSATYTPSAADETAGTVTLTLTAYAVAPCTTDGTDDMILTITPESTADAGDATATVCYNASYTASATASNGTILWTSSGDGSFTSATVEDAEYTPGTNDIANGTVTLTMTVTGACNNPSDNIVLTITPESTADAGDATATVCYNASYTASATATNASSILWTSSGDGSFTSATVEDAEYTPGTNDIAAGTVTLTMIVTGTCNNPSDNIVLTITPESTADAGTDGSVCYNGTYQLDGTATHGTILWSSPGGGSFDDATHADAVYTPSATDISNGSVTLTMTVTGTCNSPSDDMILTITPESTADAGDATATVCYNASYTASSTASNGTILWTSSGDGSFTSATVEDAEYTPGTNDIANGTVTLTMTVTGSCNNPSDNIVLTITPESTADAGDATATVCYNGTYQLDGTATHGTILWSSPGGGSFDDATQADAVYTPSATDISNGSVTLTMTVTGTCNSPSDDMILTIDQAPTANAGTDGNLCNGASYTLDGTATNHIGVLWSGGDGTFNPSATVKDPVYSPGTSDIANGTVTLTFTASDGCGSTNDQMTITINDEATAQAGPDATICEGQTYTLSGGANGHSSVLWSTSGTGSFDDATSLSATYTPSAADETAGTVTLTLTAYAVAPCTTDGTDSMILTISPASTAYAGADETICEGGSYTITDATATNYTSILWTHNGAGTLSDATTLSPSYNAGAGETGTVTLTMSVTGTCGNSTDVIDITIDAASTAYAGADETICEGGSYTITDATATNYTSILWTHNGTGSLSDVTTLSPSYNAGAGETGTVTLTMSVTGTCGNSTDAMDITIDAASAAYAGADETICEGGSYTITDATATNYTSILWTHNGTGTLYDAATLSPTYNAGAGEIGTITLTMSVTGTCGNSTDAMDITIDAASAAYAGADETICEGGSYTITDAAATDYTAIQWTHNGTGSLSDGATLSPTYNAGTGETGTVTLTMSVTGTCGNSTDAMDITIDAASTAYAGADETICEGGSYTITDATATNYTSILWTHNGTGTLYDAATLSPTYNAGAGEIGTITLTMSVTGTCGNSTDAMDITIDGASTAYAGADETICEGGSYTITDAAATDYTAIQWTHNGTGSLSDGATLSPTYNAGTGETGTVTLTMSVTGTCGNSTDAMDITIDGSSTAYAGADETICEGGSYTITDATATNYTGILWTHNGTGSFDDATSLSATYTPGTNDLSSGTVTLTLTAYATPPCTTDGTDFMLLTIDAATVVTVDPISQSACLGSGVTFSVTATGEGTLTYQWRKDGTNITGATTDSYNIASVAAGDAGDYDCVVTGDCGDATSAVATLTIDASSTAYAGSDATICEGGSYAITDATATNYTGILWTHNGTGSLSDATTLSPTYNAGTGETGTVTLTMSVTGTCGNSTDAMDITIDGSSTAYAGTDEAICEGGSYTITDATATDYTAILWTHNGTGILSNGATLSPTYTAGTGETGTVTLTMSVTGDCGNSSDEMDVTIDAASTAYAGADETICEGGSCTITDATATNYTSILWTHNGTGSLSDVTTLSPSYNAGAGETGTVTLTMSVTGTCGNSTDAMHITIDAASTAYAGADETICEGGSYTITDATATNYTSILWTHNGTGSLSDVTTLSPSYNAGAGETGTVTLTMSVTGTCGNSSDAMHITIDGASTAYAGADETICEGGSYTITDATATNYTSILWTHNGTGSLSDATTLIPTYTAGAGEIGRIILTMSVTGDCGNSADEMEIEIFANPLADAGDDGIVCEDDSYLLDGYAESYTSVLWTTSGDGSFDNSSILNATYTPGNNDISAGSVTITLFVEGIGGCDPANDEMILEVSYMPILDAGANDTICHDESYVLSGYAENESNILWTTTGDGSFDDPSLLDATYTPGENDVFAGGVELTLHAYANAPCDGASLDNIFLTIEICGYIPGLSSKSAEFKIAPNPANGYTRFYIEKLFEEEVTIQLMDMKGSLFSSETYQVVNGKVDGKLLLIGLEEGVYNIRAKSKGYLKTLRLIVTK